MEGIQAAGEPCDGAGEREDDGLEALHAIAEESDPLFILAEAGECQTELRSHQEAAQ